VIDNQLAQHAPFEYEYRLAPEYEYEYGEYEAKTNNLNAPGQAGGIWESVTEFLGKLAKMPSEASTEPDCLPGLQASNDWTMPHGCLSTSETSCRLRGKVKLLWSSPNRCSSVA